MRSKTLFSIFVASLMAYTTSAQKVNVQPIHVEAPFPMDSVHLCTFPNKEFPITKYGARKGSSHLNTQAFAQAIEACHRAGVESFLIQWCRRDSDQEWFRSHI